MGYSKSPSSHKLRSSLKPTSIEEDNVSRSSADSDIPDWPVGHSAEQEGQLEETSTLDRGSPAQPPDQEITKLDEEEDETLTKQGEFKVTLTNINNWVAHWLEHLVLGHQIIQS